MAPALRQNSRNIVENHVLEEKKWHHGRPFSESVEEGGVDGEDVIEELLVGHKLITVLPLIQSTLTNRKAHR